VLPYLDLKVLGWEGVVRHVFLQNELGEVVGWV
jgi:hypothetical protein